MAIYQVVHKATLYSQKIRNVFHFENTVALDITDQQELVDELDGVYQNRIKTEMSPDYRCDAYDVRRVDIAGQPTIEYLQAGGAWIGTGGAEDPVNQVAALVSFKAVASVPNAARKYLAGFSANNILNGVWTSLTQDNMGLWGNDVISLSLPSAGLTNYVTVRWDSTNTFVEAWNELELVIPRGVPATQRSRRIGTGI